MANRAPGTVWTLRWPPDSGYVRTTDDDGIEVALPHPGSSRLICIEMSRNDARLLAKRLNQCLDETRKP